MRETGTMGEGYIISRWCFALGGGGGEVFFACVCTGQCSKPGSPRTSLPLVLRAPIFQARLCYHEAYELPEHFCNAQEDRFAAVQMALLGTFRPRILYTPRRDDYINHSLRAILCNGRDLIT